MQTAGERSFEAALCSAVGLAVGFELGEVGAGFGARPSAVKSDYVEGVVGLAVATAV